MNDRIYAVVFADWQNSAYHQNDNTILLYPTSKVVCDDMIYNLVSNHARVHFAVINNDTNIYA